MNLISGWFVKESEQDLKDQAENCTVSPLSCLGMPLVVSLRWPLVWLSPQNGYLFRAEVLSDLLFSRFNDFRRWQMEEKPRHLKGCMCDRLPLCNFQLLNPESIYLSRFWFPGTQHSERIFVTSVSALGLEWQERVQMPDDGSKCRETQEPTRTGTSAFFPVLPVTVLFWLRQSRRESESSMGRVLDCGLNNNV